MRNTTDFYKRLGVSPNASEAEIRMAYHKAAHILHPDVNVEAGATELFLDIKEAYETLIDSEKRKAYDGIARDIPPPVQVTTHYSRDALPWMEEDQLVYTLIEMEIDIDQLTKEDETTPPINVALVLDCSTSMQGPRLEMLKVTSLELMHHLRNHDIFAMVAFNDRAEIVLPAASHANNRKNESRIRMLQTRGGTEIFQGLKAGVSEAQRNISPYYINHVILVTDGHTYGDEANCYDLAQKAAAQGIGISCLGIGGKWNDVFLDSLAKITGGSCVYISDPRDISTLLQQKFNDLGQVYAEGINLNLETGPGVQLNYAYRLQPEANVLPVSSPIRLGNIPKNYRLSLILEFLLSSISPSIQKVLIAEGSFTFTIPKKDSTTYRMPVSLFRPTSPNPRQQPPKKIIIEAMSRLTLFRMQEQAKRELNAGNPEDASIRLQNMATHLFAQGEPELAKTALKEAANIKLGKDYSEEGQKRIKYGTQGLFLLKSHKKA